MGRADEIRDELTAIHFEQESLTEQAHELQSELAALEEAEQQRRFNQAIQIRVKSDTDHREVKALLVGCLAVHPTCVDEVASAARQLIGLDDDDLTITHVTSGFAVLHGPFDLDKAVEAATDLNPLFENVPWSDQHSGEYESWLAQVMPAVKGWYVRLLPPHLRARVEAASP